jgi:hypothetical protein
MAVPTHNVDFGQSAMEPQLPPTDGMWFCTGAAGEQPDTDLLLCVAPSDWLRNPHELCASYKGG